MSPRCFSATFKIKSYIILGLFCPKKKHVNTPDFAEWTNETNTVVFKASVLGLPLAPLRGWIHISSQCYSNQALYTQVPDLQAGSMWHSASCVLTSLSTPLLPSPQAAPRIPGSANIFQSHTADSLLAPQLTDDYENKGKAKFLIFLSANSQFL